MKNNLKIFLSFLTILLIIFSSLNLNNFRIDASSDTLVAQNDEDFNYFNYYQNIFKTKNSLVIAIKSKKKLNKNLLDEIEILSEKINSIPEVSSIFNINKAPILFLNNTSLLDLSNNNYETITNTEFEINKVLDEFVKSPIYSNQLINDKKNITSLIIFLKPNKKLEDLKKNKETYLLQNSYYNKKTQIDRDREILIKKIRNILDNSSKNYEYYLGGIEMISNDVISFVKKDILIFSFIVVILVLLILLYIFKKIKWVISILISSILSVYLMIGIIGFVNFEITAVSANFLSLMFILSVSMNIHILNNYLQSQNNLIETLKVMFWPCFYTYLTTVVAFLSLIISDIKPIIDFGYVMIIALTVVLFSTFTILPLFISNFTKDENYKSLDFSVIKKFIKY